jgi:hypothetical protein
MRSSFFFSLSMLGGMAVLGCSGAGTRFEPEDAGTDVCETCTPKPDAGDAPDAPAPVFGDSGIPEAGPPTPHNLVPNGDFEQGNTLFGSDYKYATINTVEGEYTVGTDGSAFNHWLENTGDHTSGHGMMLIGNGKATPDRVWYAATIAVTPDTKYYFEAFVMNLCCAAGLGDGVNPVGPSVLSFYANGQLLGTRTSSKLGVWEGMSTDWNSGSATTVELKLVNANTDALGNDFAVDDVYLGTIFIPIN